MPDKDDKPRGELAPCRLCGAGPDEAPDSDARVSHSSKTICPLFSSIMTREQWQVLHGPVTEPKGLEELIADLQKGIEDEVERKAVASLVHSHVTNWPTGWTEEERQEIYVSGWDACKKRLLEDAKFCAENPIASFYAYQAALKPEGKENE